ncbi:beta-ketoacyl-[acyl-carrier-protein] synthase family protein [Nocardia transvalensis]|uniref:beta-ketoacyl-[acyl-carrier-protein] synthase family protein n=1 Tax=Nocardia transvalensis TaxID=37333 RepID=UPI001E4005B3|nr:beta-ketoacyl-[acyl-carrier-protein] synthase family protein [Nocardia transvalensis]
MDERDTRVVVTSLGAVTAHGIGVASLWDEVRRGNVAIGAIHGLSLDGFDAPIGGEVPESRRPKYDYLTRLGLRDPEPAVDFALLAAEEAMSGAGVAVPATRWGVSLGTCNGGIRSGERVLRRTRGQGANPRDDKHLLLVPPHVIAEVLSAAFGLRGPVLTVNTACASSAHALAHAVEIIRAGRADAMLVGGSDALTEMAYVGFGSVESLSARPAAPYSRSRDGLSLGEGSGMLVVVRADIALAAGAPILTEILSYGMSADGYHATAPHPAGEGAARAIRSALCEAGLTGADVAYINGHGTGTPKNDSAESNAVRSALGTAAQQVVLSSTKSMIGHLLGAAGAVEAIVTIKALEDQWAPPTAGFTGADPGCGLEAAPNEGRPLAMDVALSNNFAFAGANATVAYARPGTRTRPRTRFPVDDVAVTGIAAVSPAGTSIDELWQAYRAGIRLGRDEDGLRVARITADMTRYTAPRQRRRMDRLGQLAVATCRGALEHAGLDADERVGVVLGTGIGPIQSIGDFFLPVVEGGPSMANPAFFPNTVFNAAAGQVAMVLGAKGPTSTAAVGHSAGAAALTIATDLLRAGRAEAVLCCAVDELSSYATDAYRGLSLFGGRSGRDYLLAEGSITLLLERASLARARGARILAEVGGYATTSDAVGIARWDPRGRGLERAMREALGEARLRPDRLAAVWANAAGLHVADNPENRAIARLGLPDSCRVERPKRVLGEPGGAGAQLCAALAVASWKNGFPCGPALINSSSLGGTHTGLVLRPPTSS